MCGSCCQCVMLCEGGSTSLSPLCCVQRQLCVTEQASQQDCQAPSGGSLSSETCTRKHAHITYIHFSFVFIPILLNTNSAVFDGLYFFLQGSDQT